MVSKIVVPFKSLVMTMTNIISKLVNLWFKTRYNKYHNYYFLYDISELNYVVL